MPTRGRRPGNADTREQVPQAARRQFAEHGYAGATVRSIADEAGVNPALIHHYFGTKAQLHADAIDLPVDIAAVLDTLLVQTPRDELAEALVRHAIAVWRDPAAGASLRAMIRQVGADPGAPAALAVAWQAIVIPRLARGLGVPQRNVAAALATLLGLAVAGSLLGVRQLSELSEDEFTAFAAPMVDRCLHGP